MIGFPMLFLQPSRRVAAFLHRAVSSMPQSDANRLGAGDAADDSGGVHDVVMRKEQTSNIL
jgi:hypothetical protein